jgi:hypothetical protein
MFKLNTHKSIRDKVRGFIVKPIQYEVNVPTGDWTPYFGKYENQKWGLWDSDSCWALSGVNCAEDQAEMLWKNGMFSDEAKKFFTDNGYVDSDGDLSFSEQFYEILSGAKDGGNNQMNLWSLMQQYGIVPRSKLCYTQARAQQWTNQTDFDNDYFNPAQITPELKALGIQSKNYINVARQWIGTNWTTPNIDILRAAIKQAPLQLGIPVPQPTYLWNSPIIKWDGRVSADHAVECYKINDDGTLCIFDQYEPNLKVLGAGYYLPFVTQGILYAVAPAATNPVVQPVDNSFYTWIMNWFNGIFGKTQIG